MGMVVSFTRVTSAELARIKAAPHDATDIIDARERTRKEPSGYIDKAWGGLEYLFEHARIGVDLFADGELIDEDRMLYAWTAGLVSATAEQLRATPFTELAEHFDAEDMDDSDVYPTIWVRDGDDLGLGYLRLHYTELTRFFEYAAKSRSAAIMTFG
ncbi:YfbM family protein [Nocardia sp. NPDC051756]|uniref:YfbM family protein n=1 Tax=Nocardia sp. NPDC051756 TaxID=3154751 RepID=UPI003429B88B